MSSERLTTALADRYRIERELGQGGMATVYLAQDLRHDRRVALKVLRPELAAVIGAARFLVEIKTTANLQHPHILSLHDSGEVQGTAFYVMPYVEGESLRDRLAREKQLPVDDAIRIGCEVADALQYAHEHGVIHRDIKPENILLQGGHALVADFGIALAAAKTGGSRMTETGMSLGTPHYMSPEQAMGERELDARTDIYALGCVVHEMLAGEPPFTGPTAQAIVARVLTERPPPLRQKRPTVPPHVEEAVQVALQKLPADRFRRAADFGSALSSLEGARRSAPAPIVRATRSRSVSMSAGAVALAVAAFLLGRSTHGGSPSLPLVFGRNLHVTWEQGLEITPALSPDGRMVAFASGALVRLRVMVRPVGEGRAVPLTGDSTGESDPEWSPDGARVLFLSRGGVYSAPAGGGAARPEVPGTAQLPIVSATWSPDGRRIAFARGDSLLIREPDASVRGLALIAEPTRCSWSPDGELIACVSGNTWYSRPSRVFGNLSPSQIVVCRVRDGTVTAITDSLSLHQSPIWSRDGNWLYFVSTRDGPSDIYGVATSSNGSSKGSPVRLSIGLGAHSISLAGSGDRLAYSLYTLRSNLWSMPIPIGTPVTTATAIRLSNANENIENVALSADGRWLYYDSDLAGNVDIFRISATGSEPERVTTDPSDDFYPRVSPDGKELSFHSWRSGSRDIYVMRLDGGGVQRVTNTAGQEAVAWWAPDGKAIAFSPLSTEEGIWVVQRDSAGGWGTPVRRRQGGTLPAWSADGRWLAFVSSLTGGNLGLLPMPSGEERTVLDVSGLEGTAVGRGVFDERGGFYFLMNDAAGLGSIWAARIDGGAPRLVVRFDPELHGSNRGSFTVGNGRFYFPTVERQSDIWVMEIPRP